MQREVAYSTPFGMRYADLRVSIDDKVLGLLEVKVGGSPYHALQQAKDMFIYLVYGHRTDLVRYSTFP